MLNEISAPYADTDRAFYRKPIDRHLVASVGRSLSIEGGVIAEILDRLSALKSIVLVYLVPMLSEDYL